MELEFKALDEQAAAFKEEFKSIDGQLALISQTLDDLRAEQAEVTSKTFYVGKAKKVSELANEIKAAEDEQASLMEQRKAMLHSDISTDEMDKTVIAAFDEQITDLVSEHVKAINELIQQGYELSTELDHAYRDELKKVAPYASESAKGSLSSVWKFPSLTSRPTYEIRKIDSNYIMK